MLWSWTTHVRDEKFSSPSIFSFGANCCGWSSNKNGAIGIGGRSALDCLGMHLKQLYTHLPRWNEQKREKEAARKRWEKGRKRWEGWRKKWRHNWVCVRTDVVVAGSLATLIGPDLTHWRPTFSPQVSPRSARSRLSAPKFDLTQVSWSTSYFLLLFLVEIPSWEVSGSTCCLIWVSPENSFMWAL